LIRLLGDFDLAEEALHEAFAAAAEQWPKGGGLPDNPRTWLVSVGRFKAIDRIRRNTRASALLHDAAAALPDTVYPEFDHEHIEDDRLRLIFTCCHPALPPEAQVALTLREVCDVTTEELARAFLATPPTIAKRIVRAKAKIREARIPYEVPSGQQLAERLDSVLRVVYLIYTEGYAASSGRTLPRHDVSEEAIRLGRLLIELLPEAEVLGLLALMLLQESRRAARISGDSEIVLLPEQDRSLWNQSQIAEGKDLLRRAMSSEPVGSYTIQAAIAAVHADAPESSATDWTQIVHFYEALLAANPSPVVELNWAVAVSMHQGPSEGLARVDAILDRGDLQDYFLAHAARAEMCSRLKKFDEARASYKRALALVRQEPARRYLERKLAENSSE
jgi:RNA polymerase sigma-70 factor (ECF subfamily)